MLILLASACFTDPTATAEAAETSEGEKGMSARFVVVDVAIASDDDEYPVETPKNGTMVRVDACQTGERTECDQWDGGYRLYADGELILTPSVWDGDLARVTFLVIE